MKYVPAQPPTSTPKELSEYLRRELQRIANALADQEVITLLTDGVEAPDRSGTQAQIYVDVADGDLKVKFGDGTVKTISVDT